MSHLRARLSRLRVGCPRRPRVYPLQLNTSSRLVQYRSTDPPRTSHLSSRSTAWSLPTRDRIQRLIWPRGTVFLVAGVGILCNAFISLPLRLESNDYELLGGDEINQRYAPPVAPCSKDQANDSLRWEESSQMGGMGSGVLRFDTTRLPSNLPCEDEMVSASGHEDEEIKWFLWGIFDGHAGWQTAAALHDCMIRYIVRDLAALSPSGRVSDVTPLKVDQAIKNAFLDLDKDIMDQAAKTASGPSYLNDAMSQLGPAYSGSCALVSYYNSESQQLKVACVGDSRAVLGRRSASGGWDVTALSTDQTGKTPREIARLQKQHPNEPELVKDGRLLKLAVSRAFGDSRWKWARDLQEQAHKRFYGPEIIEPLLTPPYLTAEPVITTTKIQPEKGDFVIMASDGLWDNLTSEQAVNLVGRWLEENDPSKVIGPPDLAVKPPTVPNRKSPSQTMAYTGSSVNENNFTVADANAATHLVRNALGGGDEDRLCGMLTASPPFSRNMRDDISVQVIFFGTEDPYAIKDFSDD